MILFLVLKCCKFYIFSSVCLAIIFKLGDRTIATCIPVSYHSIIYCIFFLSPLVMTDDVIERMNITNATCVIHHTFPSKGKFSKRLTTLAGKFTSSEVQQIQISDTVINIHVY